jgi:dTDP-4-amino-4,6-dideoxyglucose
MAILKSSPSQLAIHGGGPPAFDVKAPVYSANAGDGRRFAELAERMFLATERPGSLVEEFERAIADWLEIRNVIGFSSRSAAVRALNESLPEGEAFAPAFSYGAFALGRKMTPVECETSTFGMSHSALSNQLREDSAAVFATHIAGRPCQIEHLEDLCGEWNVPLFLFAHQAFAANHPTGRIGKHGRAEIFEFGRDELVHAMDSAIITTQDDLLAHRLRVIRSKAVDGVDPAMSDASAAMAIANFESHEGFVASNRMRYESYRQLLSEIPGIRLLRHDSETNAQTITIEVDPGLAGLHRNALADILRAENVGVAKVFDDAAFTSTPVAFRLANSLMQLPSGPAATEEVVEAVCKLIELSIVRSLESPDPLHIAA